MSVHSALTESLNPGILAKELALVAGNVIDSHFDILEEVRGLFFSFLVVSNNFDINAVHALRKEDKEENSFSVAQVAVWMVFS